ncbi:zinc finger BED domain-containing protein RICESLEEPER 2 [Tanacetum coccineum]
MASESASTTTGVGSTSALTIREIIPTNRTPEVWKDFNMCIMTNGQKKAQCKYCFHFFSEGSNTTLKNHITHPTMSSEYEQYLKADFVSHLHPKDFATFDVLGFWKAKENQFPVLSRMAIDILSVQASSVASESAFSTSDAQERKQNTSPLELTLDVEECVFNVEVQQNKVTQLTDQEIALDASSDGSSGEPRHDYMMSSGAEDDQTGDGHDGSTSHGYY